MEDRKKRGTYKTKEINKVKLMSFFESINKESLDKLNNPNKEKE